MEKVIVKVRGEQTDMGGEKSRIEMVAEGRHYCRDGKHIILYEDNVMDNGGRISTVLKIAPDSVELLRSGAVTQAQRFDARETSVSQYRTPYGNLELAVRTEAVNVVYGTVSGQVDVCYALSVNGQAETRNELHIEISVTEGEISRLH